MTARTAPRERDVTTPEITALHRRVRELNGGIAGWRDERAILLRDATNAGDLTDEVTEKRSALTRKIVDAQTEIDDLLKHELPRLEAYARKWFQAEKLAKRKHHAHEAAQCAYDRLPIGAKLDRLFSQLLAAAAPLDALGTRTKGHFWQAHIAASPVEDAANRASCDFSAATGHAGAVATAFAVAIKPLVDLFGAGEFVQVEGQLPDMSFEQAYRICAERVSRNLMLIEAFAEPAALSAALQDGEGDDDEAGDIRDLT